MRINTPTNRLSTTPSEASSRDVEPVDLNADVSKWFKPCEAPAELTHLNLDFVEKHHELLKEMLFKMLDSKMIYVSNKRMEAVIRAIVRKSSELVFDYNRVCPMQDRTTEKKSLSIIANDIKIFGRAHLTREQCTAMMCFLDKYL